MKNCWTTCDRCARRDSKGTLSRRSSTRESERFIRPLFERRFGSCCKALKKAGLQRGQSQHMGITDEELFENLKSLWMSLGRQPRTNEVRWPGSRFSFWPYKRRFGSWPRRVKEFVAWVNSDFSEEPQREKTETNHRSAESGVPAESTKRRTRREVSERQRFRILVRDGFRCRSCGASPLTQVGVELHVDHVLPWSKGGETTDDNLLTKCKQCNLGKGNAFNA